MARVSKNNVMGTINNFFVYRENRYVLFLTENYAALDILKNPRNYLTEAITITGDGGEGVLDRSMSAADMPPFILFGSSFPKDKEYTQVL